MNLGERRTLDAGARQYSMVHVAVIGAYGSAGAAVAHELAGHPEVQLTLIDDGDPGGGLCILRGCMPSKEVLSAGAHRYQARVDERLHDPPEVDAERVIERKREHVSGFAEHRRTGIDALTEKPGVELLRETARFLDAHTLAVGDRTIEPDYIVVATGSTPKIPQLPGMGAVSPTTSADVLDRATFPDSGIIMGFGYVGMELAPYLSEVGDVDLTVIEHDAQPLDMADPEYGEQLMELYRTEFDIDIYTEARETRVEATDTGVRVHVTHNGEPKTIDAEELFTFTGRKPAVDSLGLEQAKITPDENWVKATMQTRTDPRVFVVGDANGRQPVLHVAKEQGQCAAENILAAHRGESLRRYTSRTHRVAFTGLGVYPYARVGHTRETAAAEYNGETITVTRAAADDGIFRAKDVPHGQATLVVDATDGTVLGYQGLHYHADVMAKTMQVSIELEADVRALPDRAYHPTTPEVLDGLFQAAAEQLSA